MKGRCGPGRGLARLVFDGNDAAVVHVRDPVAEAEDAVVVRHHNDGAVGHNGGLCAPAP